ncbi:ribosome small subunit-dependent GTPase A [Tindallia californiensis]|uniref:Small ribosomal subunit biogenesis GTPase RsgA n=1 Tax=Tindallia californiensis TaxID=159292 RepID=A0A1H3NUV4_9FIRM|nr:ribosome small subunit-dependent GTPase A [Tindallia californiensis]SDY92500.1 ribosome biogenesis GTPase [Tindallia californiensis]
MKEGRIIKALSGFFYVQDNKSVVVCKGRGILKKRGITPITGDWVKYSIINEQLKEGVVEEVLPRKNEMLRPPLSNLDQILAVFSVKEPIPNFVLLDRILLRAEMQRYQIGVCFNKIDLEDKETFDGILSGYEKIGYPVFFISAKSGDGIASLRNFLAGNTTALAGASGVGKSSLINKLYPSFELKTGKISEKIQRGKHTTRFTELLWADEDTWIADTPGFSTLNASDLKYEEVKRYFKEFLALESSCRFLSCLHLKEPGCSIKKAVSDGEIMEHRYKNYQNIVEEIKSDRRYC